MIRRHIKGDWDVNNIRFNYCLSQAQLSRHRKDPKKVLTTHKLVLVGPAEVGSKQLDFSLYSKPSLIV